MMKAKTEAEVETRLYLDMLETPWGFPGVFAPFAMLANGIVNLNKPVESEAQFHPSEGQVN
jgi:hypothetical protein